MQEELIQQFRDGNKQAGDDFYMANINLVKYAVKKYRLISMEDEETLALVNQAFVKTMKVYDSTKGTFSTYFMLSAKGHILRHFRDYEHLMKPRRRDYEAGELMYCDSLDRVIYQSDGTDILLKDSQGIEDDYTQVIVDEMLSRLNKADRKAFKLKLSYGLSQRQIADICGTNQVSISRSLTRSKRQLKLILKEVC